MALANYSKTCAKSSIGNSGLYLTEVANITSVTITAGEISAVTMGSGLTFHEVQADKNTIRRKQTENVNNGVINIVHSVEAKFSGLTLDLNTLRDSIADGLACGMIAIVLDKMGQAWMIGWSEANTGNDPLDKLEGEDDSGISSAELELGAWNMTLTSESAYLDLPFDTTQNAAIGGGTATYITFN